MSSTVRFTKDDCTKPGDTPPSFPYRELVACLLFVSISTRPDIAFTVKELSRWLNCFGGKHVAVAKQCIRYLAGTKQLGLLYTTIVSHRFLVGFSTPASASPVSSRM